MIEFEWIKIVPCAAIILTSFVVIGIGIVIIWYLLAMIAINKLEKDNIESDEQ